MEMGNRRLLSVVLLPRLKARVKKTAEVVKKMDKEEDDRRRRRV